jgi:hypothetical protein
VLLEKDRFDLRMPFLLLSGLLHLANFVLLALLLSLG